MVNNNWRFSSFELNSRQWFVICSRYRCGCVRAFTLSAPDQIREKRCDEPLFDVSLALPVRWMSISPVLRAAVHGQLSHDDSLLPGCIRHPVTIVTR